MTPAELAAAESLKFAAQPQSREVAAASSRRAEAEDRTVQTAEGMGIPEREIRQFSRFNEDSQLG
jgi:hypothetical protein